MIKQMLENKLVVLVTIVVVVAALIIVFKGTFGAHVGALGQSASVQVGETVH